MASAGVVGTYVSQNEIKRVGPPKEESIVWVIGNFSQKGKCKIHSPNFASSQDTDEKHLWILHLIASDLQLETEDSTVDIKVTLTSFEKKSLFFKFSVWCGDSSNARTSVVQRVEHEFTRKDDSFQIQFKNKDLIFHDLPGDVLKVCLTLLYVPGGGLCNAEAVTLLSQNKLIEDFNNLFVDKTLSDVHIVVDDVEIPAHMCILSSRSPVFAAMFKHNMEEKRTKRVEIVDFDQEIVEIFLKYLYTSRLPSWSFELCVKLLKITDYYGVDDLKDQCVNYLINNLDCTNALDVLKLANTHKIDKLKDVTMTFVCSNKPEFSTVNKLDPLKEESELLIDLIVKLTSTKLEDNALALKLWSN